MPYVIEEPEGSGGYTIEEPPAKSRIVEAAKYMVKPYIGAAEAAAANITGMAATPIAGLVGLGSLPWGADTATRNIEATHKALTWQPLTEQGQQLTDYSGQLMNTVFQKPIDAVAELGNRIAGPTGAAIGAGTMGAAELLIPAGMARIGRTKPVRVAEVVRRGELKPTLEDADVARQRIEGWRRTDELLAREPQRGRFTIEEPPVEAPAPTPTTYPNMSGQQTAIAGMYDTLLEKGVDTPTIRAQMERIFPKEVVDAEFESRLVAPTKQEVGQVVEGKFGISKNPNYVPAEPPQAPPITQGGEVGTQLLRPTQEDIAPYNRRNYGPLTTEGRGPQALLQGEETELARGSTGPGRDMPIESKPVVEEPISTELSSVTLHSNPIKAIADFYTEKMGIPAEEWLLKHTPTAIREFFSPTSTMPGSEAYKTIRTTAKGFAARADQFAGKVFDKLKPLDDTAKTNVFRAVNGEEPITNLPAEQQVLARQLIGINDKIGQMQVNAGVLTQDQVAANKGQYIHYMYLKHVLGDKGPDIGGGKIDLSVLKARKDMTQAQRRAIGLVEDISVAEPVSVSKGLHNVGMADMYKKIDANPEWTWQPPTAQVGGKAWNVGDLSKEVEIQRRVVEQNPTPEASARLAELETGIQEAQQLSGQAPEGFRKMPESKAYGALSGKFVRKEIVNDLLPLKTRVSDPSGSGGKAVNFALDVAEEAMTYFKIGKTALNLPTTARNVGSNAIQLNMSGIPAYEVLPRVTMAAKNMLQNSPDYIKTKRAGLYESNWAQGEIKEVMQILEKHSAMKKYNPLALAKDLAKYYGKVDDLFKFTKFEEQMSKGVGFEKAMNEANKWGMDYSLASRSVKAARRFAMPFVTYQYKIAPLIAESVIERPWVLAKYVAVPYAMADIARETLDLTEQDWNKLKASLPTWISRNQSYTPLPWKSPEGNVQWVNLEYFFPAQQMLALARDVEQGRFGEAVSDVGLGNPILDVYAVAKTMKGNNPPRDPYSNKEIYNYLDSPTEKAVKTSEWLLNKWMPTMLTRQGALGSTVKAITGQEDKYGKKVTPAQAAGRWVGINIVSPTKQQTDKERQFLALQARQWLGQIAKDPTVSPAKKQDALKRYKERLAEIYQGGQ
jgi:hypothetical protein